MKNHYRQAWWTLPAAAMALLLAGCGGSSKHSGAGGGSPMPGGMSALGGWEVISEGGMDMGYEHAGYGLMARFDLQGNPTITPSSPMHQPTVSGTWSGRWAARYTALTSDFGALDASDDGNVSIGVTISGSSVDAAVTYSGLDIPGLPSSLTSDPASVVDGRFEPSITVSVPIEGTITFGGVGQFGGADQEGVVGYVAHPDFLSVFYGNRE